MFFLKIHARRKQRVWDVLACLHLTSPNCPRVRRDLHLRSAGIPPGETGRCESGLPHEDQPWITLLTREDFNDASDKYASRRLVRAVDKRHRGRVIPRILRQLSML